MGCSVNLHGENSPTIMMGSPHTHAAQTAGQLMGLLVRWSGFQLQLSRIACNYGHPQTMLWAPISGQRRQTCLFGSIPIRMMRIGSLHRNPRLCWQVVVDLVLREDCPPLPPMTVLRETGLQ